VQMEFANISNRLIWAVKMTDSQSTIKEQTCFAQEQPWSSYPCAISMSER
jgi:hypothetical protein